MGDDDLHNIETISKRLQSQAERDRVRLTLHVHQEMVDEDVGLTDVLRVLESATVVENYPEHKRGPCCLVTGKDDTGRDIHVVCSTSLEMAIIITVYEPKPPKWTTPYKRGNKK